jgi:hypothetical protein
VGSHAQQAIRITRIRTVKIKTTRETAYLVMSLPAPMPNQLTWALGHGRSGHSDTRFHYVRDVLRDDAHQACTGNGPAVCHARNTSIG